MEKILFSAYEDYADAIYRHCYFRCFSRELAEDIMQESFKRTWEYMQKGKEIQNIRAFLYRTATNLVIDNARKKKEFSLEGILEENPFVEPYRDEREMQELKSIMREVFSKMRELKSEEREIITMRYVDELSPTEISEILKISPNAVSVRINRATERLREQLEKGTMG